MTTIRVLKMKLVNFKGQRDLEVNFNLEVTNIFGDNETGKTTIMDGFTWTMFGKDSLGRTDFNIKTLDSDNNVIPKLDHEGYVILDVDGVQTAFRRCYKENWVKKRGTAKEVMDGHSVEYYVDDVPLSKRDYDRRVSEICPEALFRQITNPAYFPSLKMQDQRAMLFDIVGNITNEDVLDSLITIENKYDYEPLINAFNNRKSLEDLKKQTASQKAIAKKEISDIPGRIEENNRNMPEVFDWEALRLQIQDKKDAIFAIDEQIADKSKVGAAISEKKTLIRKEIDGILNQIADIKRDIQKNANSEYDSWYSSLQNTKSELSRTENSLSVFQGDLEFHNSELQKLRDKREVLLKEYYELNASEFKIDPNLMLCPTCHRPLDPEQSGEKIAVMTNEFNTSKAEKISANKALGKSIAGQISQKEAKIKDIQDQIYSLQKKASVLSSEIEDCANNVPDKRNVEELLQSNMKYIQLSNKVEALKEELNQEYELPNTSELIGRKQTIQNEIDKLNQDLAKEEQRNRTIRRNAELESILQKSQEEIANYERIEQAILNFMKAKVALVEERINNAFSYVKFRLFGTQVDGTEYDTCECMVNGVPYSDLNTAAKINAGIDIINAICRSKGVTAPIFIDNRESVSELIPCSSQLINLIVEKGRRLTIQ